MQECISKWFLATGKKHELVERLAAETEGDKSSKTLQVAMYDGNFSEVPSSVSQLTKQPVRFLHAVLRFMVTVKLCQRMN